jgi:hypothetical protein
MGELASAAAGESFNHGFGWRFGNPRPLRARWYLERHGNMLQLLSRRGRHGQTLRRNRIGKEGRSLRHRSAAGADVTCRDRVCAFQQVVSATREDFL